MSCRFDGQLFQAIFSDAHVIDVDFSRWDKGITLCVLADHVESDHADRLPAFLVTFLRVRRFFCNFSHYETTPNNPNQHFQWRIDDYKIERIERLTSIKFMAGSTSPIMDLLCEGVEILPIASEIIDQVSPGWNEPNSGFARPGIEALHRIIHQQNRCKNGGNPSDSSR